MTGLAAPALARPAASGNSLTLQGSFDIAGGFGPENFPQTVAQPSDGCWRRSCRPIGVAGRNPESCRPIGVAGRNPDLNCAHGHVL